MRHLPDRCCRVLSGFLHWIRLCRLSDRWLCAVLSTHVLRRQFVGLLHKCHLVIHSGRLAFLAFQFRFQRSDALQQFVHIRVVVLRLFIEVAERGIEVAIGGCGRLDGLRGGFHVLFRSSGIGKVEVPATVRFRHLSVEHIAQFLHGAAAVLLPFLHRPLLVCFRLVADDLAVRLVSVGHFDVVTTRSRLLFLVGRRGEYQPHSPDEYQHHSGQHYHFLTFQPLGFGQRLALLLRFPIVGSRLVFVFRFILRLFHINKVLRCDCFTALRTVPPVRHGLLLSGCRHSCRCHRRLCRRCRWQAPRRRRASPARCACVSSGVNRPDSL